MSSCESIGSIPDKSVESKPEISNSRELKKEDHRNLVELCNMLGFEQLALDVDFTKTPKEILKEYSEVLPPRRQDEKKEVDIEGLSDSAACKELYVRIASMALDTFYERIPSDDNDVTYAEKLDNALGAIDLEIMVVENAAESDNVSVETLVEKYPHYLTAIQKAQRREIHSLLNNIPLGFSLRHLGDSVEHASLQAGKPEGIDPNCIYYAAAAITTLRNLNIDESNIRTFVAGFHIGTLFKDPTQAKYLEIYDGRGVNIKVQTAYNEKVSTQSFFENYSLETEGIITSSDFCNETDHLGLMAPPKAEQNLHVTFLPPEEGFLTALYVNRALVAEHADDLEKARSYYELAQTFDPLNDFAKNHLDKIENTKKAR